MDPAVLDLARRLGLPDDPIRLTKLNGAAQGASGALLALGRLPRVSSAVLLATMVPSNLIGPRYWEVTEPQERARQRNQFLKNLALGGGLLLGVADTAGRPSVGWWANRAARRTAAAAVAATTATSDAATGLVHGVADTATGLVHGVSGTATGLLHGASSGLHGAAGGTHGVGRGVTEVAVGLAHGVGHGAESLASGAAAGLSGAVAALEHYAGNPKNRRRAKRLSRCAAKTARRAAKAAARDLALAKQGLRTEAGQVAEAARSARAGVAHTPALKRLGRRHRRHAARARGSAKEVLAGVAHHLGSH